MSHQVFLSYSTQDSETTTIVCERLEAEGIACWLAPRDIAPGAAWAATIIKAINTSEVLVLMFSSNSNASDQVKREVDRAINKKIPILTFRIDDELPSGEMEYYLATSQWFDATAGELDEHVNVLIDTIKSGEYAKPSGSLPGHVDEHAVEKGVEEVSWILAEIEASETPITSADIDKVFETAIERGEPVYDAGLHEGCAQIYLQAAKGIRDRLENPGHALPIHYPSHIEMARSSLQRVLTEFPEVTSDNASRFCHKLQTVFTDFIDRVDDSTAELNTRWPIWLWIVGMLAISWASIVWSYATSTRAWQIHFSYPFGGPSSPSVGHWLEMSRSLLLAVMMFYLLEFTFRMESGRFFDLLRSILWRSKLIVVTRVGMLLFALLLGYGVTIYHVREAPQNLMDYAKVQFEENDELSKADKDQLKLEKDQLDGHLRTYLRYLAYSLVNYVGFAVPFMFVGIYSVALDARELVDERQSLYNALGDIHVDGKTIDKAFEKFYNTCQKKSRRYLILFAWVAGSVAFEQIITKDTLTRSALIYEFLASLTIGLTTLIWIGFLCHFYEGAFQRCLSEKRRRRLPTEDWETSRRTLKFLVRCIYNHVGGIFAILYLWPFIFEFAKWTSSS